MQGVVGAKVASRRFKPPVKVKVFNTSELLLPSSSSFNFDCCEAACLAVMRNFSEFGLRRAQQPSKRAVEQWRQSAQAKAAGKESEVTLLWL